VDPKHDDVDLKPVAESRAAFDWLGYYGDQHVEESMARMGQVVREIVPSCVAISLTVAADDLTFTLMSERPGAALLDAMQFLDGGPCELAVEDTSIGTTSDLPTDEGRWQLFARAEAFTGIASTLSLPVIKGGAVVGGVNLYASESDAFDGHHDEIADACGAWAEGAVTNADLSFTTRVRAAAAPERLRERGTMDVACGYVAAHQDIELEDAATRIRQAARRAGVTEIDFARFILDAHGEPVV
jgi:GAF domain-containing protein